jgi:hypothetical protein
VEGFIIVLNRRHIMDWRRLNLGMLLTDGDIIRNGSGLGLLGQVDWIRGVHLGGIETKTLISETKGKCSPFKAQARRSHWRLGLSVSGRSLFPAPPTFDKETRMLY